MDIAYDEVIECSEIKNNYYIIVKLAVKHVMFEDFCNLKMCGLKRKLF